MFRTIVLIALVATATPAAAQQAQVIAAEAIRAGDTWTFSVTVRSSDTGWDRYADGWEIVAPDGQRLGYRELLHPHVTEQPFTRSLGDVSIPTDVPEVILRAHDSAEGWGPAYRLILPDGS